MHNCSVFSAHYLWADKKSIAWLYVSQIKCIYAGALSDINSPAMLVVKIVRFTNLQRSDMGEAD